MMLFKSKKPGFEYLRKKWVEKHRNITQNLFDKHLQKIAATSLGGLMLLSTPGLSMHSVNSPTEQSPKISGFKDTNKLVAAELADKVPSEVRALDQLEEQKIVDALSNSFGLKVAAELEGKRLNKNYGLIGGEQHLYRYPGDNMFAHSHSVKDWAMFGDAGIAPGLGAWGYFAPSKDKMTQEIESQERYYLAVQTFLSPGYAERTGEYRDFFKYRKMLVVNPKTGQAVVADIADAGPSEWTGKHLGGSPEVMHELGLATGPRKGAVLFFFISDPDNKIPLGPIKPKDTLIAKK